MAGVSGWDSEVLDFWFGLSDAQHWNGDPELDARVSERFVDLWDANRLRSATDFIDSAETALAAVILFDQFPRNMFRGRPESFATDALARAIADAALDRGYDGRFEPQRRLFFYLPFEHSEDLADQQRAVDLFTRLGDRDKLDFARRHYDIIARFGRFPHRNPILGRASTPEETAAGDVKPF